ncbi:FISUMP domain-containing protein [uncultured Fibrobacter sp.]|uniref:FISUMP domain-containing protein n=1 Tax=uncultured Fibrobacter sp. TaxID=261512 RepID=UPI0025E744BC|nr:FISUMP domain-containing protein [uncultured Fibrobacter sp.]
MLVSCGDDDSGKSLVQSEFGESSSGEVDSSSSDKVTEPAEGESSSSSKKIALSSSTPRSDKKLSSSSSKEKKSSSSSKVETSSSKKSSSSSSNPRKDNKSSSSSAKSSSSSDKSSSSSGKLSSSSDKSSSSSAKSSSSSDKSSSSSAKSSSSSEKSSSSSAKSSSSSAKSSSSSAKSSSSSDKSSSSSVKSSSSSAKSSSSSLGIPFEIYDCSEHKCVTTIYLNPNIEYGEFLDTRDDQVYRTVKIGEQTWMAQNLNYKMEGSRCLCQGGCLTNANSDSLCSVYGRLYTWDAANNACPPGWRLPSDDKDDKDYKILSSYVEENNHGMAVGTSLKAGKNDIWGFSGLFSGFRTSIGADTYDHKGYYWTNEEKDDQYAFGRTLGDDEDFFGWRTADKEDWLSIRCIKK